MKNYLYYTGIDVSKKTLDYCVLDAATSQVVLHGKIANDITGISKLFDTFSKRGMDITRMFFCFENTGVYSLGLHIYFSEHDLDCSEVPALEIKRSRGLRRGKSDTVDAKDIALYSIRNRDKLKISRVPSKEIMSLKILLSEREKTVEAIKSFCMGKENVGFVQEEVLEIWQEGNKNIIEELRRYLHEIEQKMEDVIKQTEELSRQQELLMSIPGIGKTIAVYVIIATRGFTSFSNARKFACYAGVAPFEYSSGASVRGKTRVSPLADKKIKALLHLAAINAIRSDKELKDYYQRKKKEGKHSLLVLNNVKFKLIGRIFAVVNRDAKFVNTLKFSA